MISSGGQGWEVVWYMHINDTQPLGNVQPRSVNDTISGRAQETSQDPPPLRLLPNDHKYQGKWWEMLRVPSTQRWRPFQEIMGDAQGSSVDVNRIDICKSSSNHPHLHHIKKVPFWWWTTIKKVLILPLKVVDNHQIRPHFDPQSGGIFRILIITRDIFSFAHFPFASKTERL